MPVDREQIKRDLVDNLYWDDRVNASDVNIDIAEDGTEILHGKVPNFNAKAAACNDAWLTSGVTNVLDHMTVEYPTTRQLPTDEELKSSLIKILALNSSIVKSDIDMIDMSVRDGIVTLRGSVNSYWKKLRTEELALDVVGVVDVINELAVIPTESLRDRDIADNIIKSYERNPQIDPNEINLEVKNGSVKLEGTISSWTAMQNAIYHAKFAPGVKAVLNSLRIV
jgi:osmotically-inducible protein OsmY